MTRRRLALSIALSDNPNTRPLIDGDVVRGRHRLTPTGVHPSEMFWRQLKFAEFDVSEMSMSSLMIATAHGPTPWVALPVFTTREFFHTRMLVRADAGIAAPADLEGKRVGVPEYPADRARSGAAACLEYEFGVHPRDMEFSWSAPPSAATAARPASSRPPGVTVHQIPPATNIGEMLLARRARRDAALSHRPQPGRPQPHRSRRRPAGAAAVRRPRRRGPPLLRQDRHLPDQPLRRGPPHARRAASRGSR